MLRREPTRIELCASDRDELDDHLRGRAAAPDTTTPTTASASTPGTPSPQPGNSLLRVLHPPPAPSKAQRLGLSNPMSGSSS
ncbi:hypothetical protein PAHAL_5G353100 [Panicum hallii]|uniref:Uncharacterized protein n=1 Tax=Panicum hallii TaxID=206008 RepID=A0A2T8IM90_9POAL|nr:hypothetical protein PAHAL_5G353100 [Panicum hallii]